MSIAIIYPSRLLVFLLPILYKKILLTTLGNDNFGVSELLTD